MNLTNFRSTAKGNVSEVADNPSAPSVASAPPVGFTPTPLSNTGLKCPSDSRIDCGVDYLTFVLPIPDAGFVFDELESIAKLYSDAIEYHWGQGRFIGRQWANWAQSPNGILVVWNLPGENCDSGSMRIALSGKALCRVDVPTNFRLLSRLLKWGAKVNRIDFKADDYSRLMIPSDMIQAYRDGNYSGFRQAHFHDELSGDIYESGWTLYLGSRQSEKLARYYNAFPVHGIEAFRFEVEFKDENANVIANEIDRMIANDNAKYNSDSNAAKRVDDYLFDMIPRLILGKYKFIDRSGGARSSRCDDLPFWSAFEKRMGGKGISFSPPKIVSVVQKSIAWVERSVAPTLAMIAEYTGADKLGYLRYLVELGREKLSARHQTIINASRREPDRQYPTDEGYVWATNFSMS